MICFKKALCAVLITVAGTSFVGCGDEYEECKPAYNEYTPLDGQDDGEAALYIRK